MKYQKNGILKKWNVKKNGVSKKNGMMHQRTLSSRDMKHSLHCLKCML